MMTYAIAFGEWTKVGKTVDPARIRLIVRAPRRACRVPVPLVDDGGCLVGLWDGDHEAAAHAALILDHPHVSEWFRGDVMPRLTAALGRQLPHDLADGAAVSGTTTMRVGLTMAERVRERAQKTNRSITAELQRVIDAGLAAMR